MAERLNDPDRVEADQSVQEARDALRNDSPRIRELQNIADVIDEDDLDDLEDIDADGVDQGKP